MIKKNDPNLGVKVCRSLRKHPISLCWLFTCGAFAAGLAGTAISAVVLAALLGAELSVVVHVVGRPDRRGPQHERPK